MATLERVYYDPAHEGGLGGIAKLSRAANRSVTETRDWLSYQDPYTLHAPRKLTFARNQMYAPTMFDTFQADLCDMQRLSPDNGGFKHVLTVIDVFSRFLWVFPLKNKSGPETARAFESLFSKGNVPLKLNTDKGGEFQNAHVQRVLKKYKVRFYTTDSEKKASVVERVNRTLKERLWRYFTRTGSRRYIHVLPRIVEGYNKTKHRSIGMAPVAVTLHNEDIVWKRLYGSRKSQPQKLAKFKVNDLVRVSNPKTVFQKGYKGLWSHEVFVVEKVIRRTPLVYRIKDKDDEPVTGVFYEPELQRVRQKQLDPGVYAIEKVLTRKKVRGKLYLRVKWLNYTKPTWIPATDLVTP